MSRTVGRFDHQTASTTDLRRLPRAPGLRKLVEAGELVADADLADRPPRDVGVEDRRVGTTQ
jgi:hypothetical protein